MKGEEPMPPKFKFTRQQIVDAAVDVTRQGGASALTARALAARLGCSVKPIFGLFENMQQVQQAVLAAADALYQSYIQRDMASGQYPPYKASGMAYIRFAKEEPELFKLLFMRDRTGETPTENRQQVQPLIDLIRKNAGLSESDAYLFHMEMWLYVHGIATMIATAYLNWDDQLVSRVLTDAYLGLCSRYAAGGREPSGAGRE